MVMEYQIFLAVILNTIASYAAVELTFELPDNEVECFHEVIDKGVECVLEYQVHYPQFIAIYIVLCKNL